VFNRFRIYRQECWTRFIKISADAADRRPGRSCRASSTDLSRKNSLETDQTLEMQPDTELDRQVLDLIKDPLMVHNSADHKPGIRPNAP
jgi:hypothetical protein